MYSRGAPIKHLSRLLLILIIAGTSVADELLVLDSFNAFYAVYHISRDSEFNEGVLQCFPPGQSVLGGGLTGLGPGSWGLPRVCSIQGDQIEVQIYRVPITSPCPLNIP